MGAGSKEPLLPRKLVHVTNRIGKADGTLLNESPPGHPYLDALHSLWGRPPLQTPRPLGFLRPGSGDLHSGGQLQLHLARGRFHSNPNSSAFF